MEILESINSYVWGLPTVVLILGVGLCLSVFTGFVQLSLFPHAFRSFLAKFRRWKCLGKSISAYQALCTALAATVGTGNIAGVAGAISIGGPGAVFWMWVSAWIGMATKYAEATLSVRYRVVGKDGSFYGGPMYMIRDGMGKRWKPLAVFYCFCGVLAAFGVGNATQVNTLIGGMHAAFRAVGVPITGTSDILIGVAVAAMVAVTLLGGAKRIGYVAERLVPIAACAYLLLGFGVILKNADRIPEVLERIVTGAFSPYAVTGGVIGSAFQSMRIGVSRGVFTNEAGMGTASIAHAAADVNHPVEQGLMGIMEVFLDTIVICTVTAFVILCTDISIPYGADVGVLLTTEAFACVYGDWVCIPMALFLCCFAFATILGWGLYGIRCAQFLLGEKVWKPFVTLQTVVVVFGAVLGTGTIWLLSETVNGLMAVPNLIALFALSPELFRLTEEYKMKICRVFANGGNTYENVNQCKPLRAFAHAEISPYGIGSGAQGKEDISSEHRSA